MARTRLFYANPVLSIIGYHVTEIAFIDNKEDVKCIDTLEEQKAFGIAYAKGILKYFGIEWEEE